ncbi:TIGR02300 family protein [Chelativorans sp. Marseille-P2723]|uniref:TIGR02300 family protein n=1 Tax=Chelativorans sp. Marseille-P2723 TaxID=2709133 RepID=UPI0015703239|nr:TIGR02300 family protein [Chelativorans sp. Marseille-P2723]
MARPELGTKRICPETGRKFYDLNRDPIVSPYTGQSYPRSYFEAGAETLVDDEEELEEKELDAQEGPEIISLEDADDDVKGSEDDLPELDDDDVDLGDDDDDTFLADEEEDDDDVTGIIGVSDDDDEH